MRRVWSESRLEFYSILRERIVRCSQARNSTTAAPFTADDVVYTLNLISDPASKMSTPPNYNWIEKAERPANVKLKRPTPAALGYFAMVLPIYPKAYREKVGAEPLCQGALAPVLTG